MAATNTEPLLPKLRNIFFGKPIRTSREQHERLSLFLGLPVFASDALSSAAYATEAIISVLILASLAAMGALRQKIESDASHPRFIRTETGVGYRLLAD